MTLFGFDSTDGSSYEAKALRTGVTEWTPEAHGAFQSVGGGILRGAVAGAGEVDNMLLGTVGTAAAGVIDKTFDTDAVGWVEEAQGNIDRGLARLEPDPRTYGFFGQLGYGVATLAAPLVVGSIVSGGNPVGISAFVGATTGNAAKRRLMAQGADENTATAAGAFTGLINAAGFMVPGAIGGRLATRVASGVGINVGLGAADRGYTGEVLRKAGYSDMAEQYKALDGMGLAVDAVTGGIFGALHRPQAKPIETPENAPEMQPAFSQSEIDASLVMNSIQHLETATPPGLPANMETRNAHIRAMDTAREQLFRGEQVNVSEAFSAPERMNFVAKPGGFIEQAFLREIAAKTESGDRGAALKLQQEYDAALQRDDNRLMKLREVISKQESAALEAQGYRQSLQQIEEELKRKPTPTEKLAAFDPETAQRLDMLEAELQKPNLSKKRRAELEAEKALVEGTRKGIDIKAMAANEKARVDGLTKQRDSLLRAAESAEKKAARYTEEVTKRRGKIAAPEAEQRLSLPQDLHETIGAELRQAADLGIFPSLNERAFNEPPEAQVFTKAAPTEASITELPEAQATAIDAQLVDMADRLGDMEVRILDDFDGVTDTTVREALEAADREITEASMFSKLYNVAVNCFIRNGQ